MASRFVLPFADIGSGITPADGAQLFFFETGTSTPKDTYSNSAGTVANANPVIADASGVFSDIFISGSYKVQLKDKNNVQQWEADPVAETVGTADATNDKRYGPVFATATDLMSGTPTAIDGLEVALTAGMNVTTLGRKTSGDGGGGSYVIQSGDTSNSVNKLLVSGTNTAVLLDPLTTKRGGAFVDGSTDDSATISAIDAVGPFTFSAGVHKVSASVSLSSASSFEPGASLSVDNTFTVTFGESPSIPAESQVFSGLGGIVLPNMKVLPEWFGAVADNTDSAARYQICIDSLTSGGVIDGRGQNYRIDSGITHKANIEFNGCFFDGSNAGAITLVSTNEGSKGADIAVTADIVAGVKQITVADTSSFSVNQYVQISSTDDWSVVGAVKLSEIARIKSIDSGVLMTFYGELSINFLTADTAKVNGFTLVEGIRFVNSGFTGDGVSGQNGIDYQYCYAPFISGIESTDIASRHVLWENCIAPVYLNGKAIRAQTSGLGYGLAIVGCLMPIVDGMYSEDCRHSVTFGGTSGITQGGTVSNIVAQGTRAAFLDTHPAARDIVFNNCISTNPNSDSNEDGVTMQGINITMKNIILRGGMDRHGALIQCIVDYDGLTHTFFDIDIKTENDGQTCLFFEQTEAATIDSLRLLVDGKSPGTFGVVVEAEAADINWIDCHFILDGVSSAGSEAVRMRNFDPFGIKGGTIKIRSRRDNDSDNNVYMIGTATNKMQDLVFTGVVENGDIGIRVDNEDPSTINITGMVFRGMSSSNTLGIT